MSCGLELDNIRCYINIEPPTLLGIRIMYFHPVSQQQVNRSSDGTDGVLVPTLLTEQLTVWQERLITGTIRVSTAVFSSCFLNKSQREKNKCHTVYNTDLRKTLSLFKLDCFKFYVFAAHSQTGTWASESLNSWPDGRRRCTCHRTPSHCRPLPPASDRRHTPRPRHTLCPDLPLSQWPAASSPRTRSPARPERTPSSARPARVTLMARRQKVQLDLSYYVKLEE